jgi:simple sugar transport system permease protein
MSEMLSAPTSGERDERLAPSGFSARAMRRPELGALAGLALVLVFFGFFADRSMFTLDGAMTIMAPAAELGILAVAAALLMIGGEFGLSVGSMIAFAGLVFAAGALILNLPFLLVLLVTLAVAGLLGVINASIVLRTRLPSFIVTLAFMFMLRGLALVGLKAVGGSTQVGGLKDAVGDGFLQSLFTGNGFTGLFAWLAQHDWIAKFPSGLPTVAGIPVSVVWFVGFAAAASFVLLATPLGNWIFAAGGDQNAARNSGVPVGLVKTALFALTAGSAALVAVLQIMNTGSTDALRGDQKEFEAIIAAVIGGCLLTGGYGSAVGALFGSIIFGTVSIGLTYTRIDADWFKVFLGAMLLIAVLFNNYVRRKVTGEG